MKNSDKIILSYMKSWKCDEKAAEAVKRKKEKQLNLAPETRG